MDDSEGPEGGGGCKTKTVEEVPGSPNLRGHRCSYGIKSTVIENSYTGT